MNRLEIEKFRFQIEVLKERLKMIKRNSSPEEIKQFELEITMKEKQLLRAEERCPKAKNKKSLSEELREEYGIMEEEEERKISSR